MPVDVSQTVDDLSQFSFIVQDSQAQDTRVPLSPGGKFPYKTRQAATCPEGFSFEIQHPVDSGTVRQVTGNKLDLSKNGWCWRSVEMFNTIPDHIRLETNLVNFKKKLKVWVDLNVSI